MSDEQDKQPSRDPQDPNRPGKVVKVLFFDDQGEAIGEPASTQLPDDPFSNRYNERSGLQSPPFALEQLLFLSEAHPIHGSAIEQKATDVIGSGWEWEASHDDADEDERDEIDAWFRSLARGEQTMEEQLQVAQEDFETVGQGLLEVVRDATGEVAGLFHVPAHTCRFHRDGIRIAQIRGEKIVWFKRWGAPTDKVVNKVTGVIKDVVPEGKEASEMLVIQKPSSRSTWYGVPKYVSAIGWISLALAVRDDNLLFFANRREPRWAVILTNLEDDDDLQEDLRRAFQVDLKQPHRNILVPISGNGKITFEKLSNDRMDGSFEKLGMVADTQILVSHRMPPERLGFVKIGNLGGNVAIESSRVYREAVIEPRQSMLNARINRFIEREYKRSERHGKKGEDNKVDPLPWMWCAKALDLSDEAEDLKEAAMAFTAGLITLDEARRRIKEDPLEKPEETEDPEAENDEAPEAQLDDEAEAAQGEEKAIKSDDGEEKPYYGDKFYFELFGKVGSTTTEASPAAAALSAGGLFGGGYEKDPNEDEVLRKIDHAVSVLLEKTE